MTEEQDLELRIFRATLKYDRHKRELAKLVKKRARLELIHLKAKWMHDSKIVTVQGVEPRRIGGVKQLESKQFAMWPIAPYTFGYSTPVGVSHRVLYLYLDNECRFRGFAPPENSRLTKDKLAGLPGYEPGTPYYYSCEAQDLSLQHLSKIASVWSII